MNFAIQSTFEKTKTLSWRIAATAGVFSILFHHTEIGLNLGLFMVLLLAYWSITYPKRFLSLAVALPAAACLTTALAAAWYGTPDTILWSFISLLILSRQLYFPEQSLLLSETKSFLNLFIAPVAGIRTLLVNDPAGSSTSVSKGVRALLFVVLPLSFTWLFAIIYSQLNPYFAEAYYAFTANLDLSLVFTVLLGMAVAFILLKPVTPTPLLTADQVLSNEFSSTPKTLSDSQKLERQVGIVLFSLLNLTLTGFLISDIFFVEKIASGMADEYSEYVHQGVELLIFSIVIATAFILYFFRNAALAKLSKNDWLKALGIVWVMLNIGILITTAFKNSLYIGEYSLSLKRVGVFIYLTLAATGLAITLVKLYRAKTNAFLFRQLYWGFFLILSVNVCIDWSSIITRYNIRQHERTSEPLDWQYLLSLNERVLPILYYQKNRIHFASHTEIQDFDSRLTQKLNTFYTYHPDWRETSLAKKYAQSQLWKK